jgi:ribosomal protein S18 acetylase RimI-like enzyme
MDIRDLTSADCDAAAVVVTSNSLWTQHYPYPRERVAAELREGLARGDSVIGAFESELIGFAWVIPRGAFGRYPYLRLLAVAPAAHGGGAGARLLSAAEARFSHERQFFLLCSHFNEGAQRFYRRQGFSYIGTIPDFARDGIGEQLWVKRL